MELATIKPILRGKGQSVKIHIHFKEGRKHYYSRSLPPHLISCGAGSL